MTTLGKTPQNQIDALPIIDVVQAANPGSITILGNKMVKYWNNTDLAMAPPHGAPAWGGGGQSFSESATLDLRGCKCICLVLQRAGAVASLADGLQCYLIPVATDGTWGPANNANFVAALTLCNGSNYIFAAGAVTSVVVFTAVTSFGATNTKPMFNALALGMTKLAVVGFGANQPPNPTSYSYDLWATG